jgi:glycosyltransferase involved in cell wall biosynthesis
MKTHTIIIPTKDRPKMLVRAVNSALAAIDKKGEILVIDDNSKIPAVESLAQLNDPRIHVYVNEYKGGVSGVRNFGLSKSQGAVVFFLDDDDEILPDYCRRILSLDPLPDYGFSSYLEVTNFGKTQHQKKQVRIRFSSGPIPDDAPLNKRLFGFGMGFWAKRSVFQNIGNIDENLKTNEDTEYGCRLISVGLDAWYSAEPGTVIYTHNRAETGDLHHITHRVTSDERAKCILYICERYPSMVHHLGRTYVKHCIKSNQFNTAWDFTRNQQDLKVRVNLYLMIFLKFIAYRLTGKMQRLDRSRFPRN